MLKIFADECIPSDVISALRCQNFDVLTVKEAGLTGTDDDAIFDFALENKRVLLTLDRGFGDIFHFKIAKSAGVIIILINQMSHQEIVHILLGFLSIAENRDLKSKLVIIGKTKIRISGR